MLRIERKIYNNKKWYQDLKPKRLTPTLSKRPVIIGWLSHIFYFEKPIKDQTTFIYCPDCRLELISTNSFVEEYSDHICKFKCNNCGRESIWDFNPPTPILLEGDKHGTEK